MAKRKFSNEEVKQWQKEHNQYLIYFNKNDSNLFVRRYNFISGNGGTLNLAHPGAWVIIVVLAGVILTVIFHKQIFG
jgi:Predicted membrane protein